MKSRNLGARLAILASSTFALAGFGSALGAAPAAARTNPSVSNPSVFACGCEPSFTIEKRQEIAGSGSGFTTSTLRGAIGQTVDYEIVVTNTGNTALRFSEFTDPHCDEGTIAGGPGTSRVARDQSTTYTCSHLLTAVGAFTNEATVTGNPLLGRTITQTSNQVVVEVPPHPVTVAVPAPPARVRAFSVEKLQEVAGLTGFTTLALNNVAIGATLDYEIVVRNTGNEALEFSGFSDPHCDTGTIAGGPGKTSVAPGSSTTYTCRHVMGEEKTYVNVASVTGAAPGEAPLTQSSNPVEANETVKCFKERQEVLHGATGPKRAPFTVHISSAGLNQATFYLDGRKLKTLKQSQAKGGKFTIKIDPRKLSRGAHTLSMKAIGTDPTCGSIAASGVFVRPGTAVRSVKFTG